MTFLPNVNPLHIFEPRYVQLLQDAMDDRRIIAMPMLDPSSGDQSINPAWCQQLGLG